ncbi:MAG: hypothetical protein ACREO5_04940 [Candidatus Binatia bacterium]
MSTLWKTDVRGWIVCPDGRIEVEYFRIPYSDEKRDSLLPSFSGYRRGQENKSWAQGLSFAQPMR